MIASSQHPVSLRISVTDLCQLRCSYCMPSEGVEKRAHTDILSFEEILRFVRTVKSRFGLSKVHITGGEPLVRPGVVDLVAMLAAEGIDDLALTTNAQNLGQSAKALKQAGLDRVNISLDSLDEGTFATLTGGGQLKHTLGGIEAALREGFSPIKLNTVVLKGCNDAEVTKMAQWAIERGCRIRFLELMPIGCAKAIFDDLFVPASEVRRRLEKSFVLEALSYTPGQSSRNFIAHDSGGRQGVIGFITARSEPFCSGCRRMRLTSTGQLISCLARGKGRDIRGILRQESERKSQLLEEILTSELLQKRAHDGFDTSRAMASVGG